MPTHKRIPEALPQDELVLAALDRAERHSDPDHGLGVHLATLKEHAGLDRGGWSTLRLRPQLERLEAAKHIRHFKRRSSIVWTLTDAGRTWLADVRATGELAPLPEAPRHRCWREAHEAARVEIDQLHADLGMLLKEAMSHHRAQPQPSSEVWRDLSERLANACTWLGSATYCLREWPEPDDDTADLASGGPREIIPWSRQRTAPGEASRP
jgi:hypothetical protein